MLRSSKTITAGRGELSPPGFHGARGFIGDTAAEQGFSTSSAILPTEMSSLARGGKVVGGIIAFTAVSLASPRSPSALRPIPPWPWRRAIIAIMGPSRPLEGRLLGFDYARFEVARGVPPLSPRQWSALRKLDRALSRDPSPRALADRAVIKVLAGRTATGLPLLEEAAARAPHDAAINSDLAALLLERGDREHSPRDYALALAAADRAVRREPDLAEGRFNRGLAFERLALAARARADFRWRSRWAGEQAWSAEARERGGQLPVPSAVGLEGMQSDLQAMAFRGAEPDLARAVDSHRRQARKLVEEELLGRWGELTLAGNRRGSQVALSAAMRIGRLLASISDDRLAQQAAEALASCHDDSPSCRRLASGHAAYRQAAVAYSLGDYDAAAADFEQAQNDLAAGGSPFVSRARYGVACSAHYRAHRQQARALFSSLGEHAAKFGYRSLAGESLWMSGLASFEDGDLGNALADYREALQVFAGIGEWDNVAGIENLIGEVLDYEGEAAEAWQFRIRALRTLPAIADPQRRYQLHTVAAFAAFQQGLPEVALYYQDEAVTEAMALGNPVAAGHALVIRARYRASAHETGQACADLEHARRWAGQIAGDAPRDRVLIDAALVQAESAIGSPAARLGLLDAALALAQRDNYLYQTVSLLLLRGRLLRESRSVAAALDDLARAIELVEAWRSQILDFDQKAAYLDKAREVFEEMVSLEAGEAHDSGAAFAYLDRQRARVLFDRVSRGLSSAGSAKLGAGSRGATVAGLARLLPDATSLLTYALIGDRIFAWVVDRGGVREALSYATPAGLARSLRVLRQGPGPGVAASDFENAANLAYDALIAPVRAAITGARELIFDCDGELQGFPFAVLRHSAVDRFLVEDFALSVTPSAWMLGYALEAAGRAGHHPNGAPLVVGDPAFDRRAYLGLAPLPAARDEARSIAALYSQPVLLVGDQATHDRFLSAARTASVIHYAGHAIEDRNLPFRSRLVLAADPAARRGHGTGDLSVEEISSLHLRDTRLVVLAACRAASGPMRNGEGTDSIARAFLATGVRAVVAGLWEVADGSSAELFTDFHRRLLAGEAPSQALRDAQLRLLRRPPPGPDAFAWAAFELVGW
jgi:CHAT domain-containing protein